MAVELRPFTYADFYGFSGAEGWDDGTPPRIADGSAGDVKEYGDYANVVDAWILVVDRTGVEIYVLDGEGSPVLRYAREETDRVKAERLAAMALANGYPVPADLSLLDFSREEAGEV